MGVYLHVAEGKEIFGITVNGELGPCFQEDTKVWARGLVTPPTVAPSVRVKTYSKRGFKALIGMDTRGTSVTLNHDPSKGGRNAQEKVWQKLAATGTDDKVDDEDAEDMTRVQMTRMPRYESAGPSSRK